MKNPNDELVWQGRIHIGDEPGVFGDAAYSGLCAELPMTLRPFDAKANRPPEIALILDAENVHVFDGYPGHSVTVFAYAPDGGSVDNKWKQALVQADHMKDRKTVVHLKDLPNDVNYISVQVRVDTTVEPGLYNDFVWHRLSVRSTTHYATLGFENL